MICTIGSSQFGISYGQGKDKEHKSGNTLKKTLTYILFILLAIFAISTYSLAEQSALQHAWFNFDGQWLPDVESSKIGPNNFQTYQNFRPVPGGIEGVQGDTKINTTALTVYQDIANGYHFIKPSESHVLAAAGSSGVTYIYDNTTAVPSQGDFSSTTLYAIDTTAPQVRFSPAPNGHVAILDGKESLIWGGDEMRVAAFIIGESAVTDDFINPKNYTDQVNNKLSTSDEVAIIGGGGPDSFTVALLHFDGSDGSQTVTDSSTTGHAVSAANSMQISTAQKKFGTASGLFASATNDFMSLPESDDWYLESGRPWTIDFWVRFNTAITGDVGFFTQGDASSGYQFLLRDNSDSRLKFRIGSDDFHEGASIDLIGPEWNPNTDQWYHIAIVHGWNDVSNRYGLLIDGVSQVTLDSSSGITEWELPFHIGLNVSPDTGTSNYFDGYIDEFRFSQGVARWTEAFGPPARAHGETSNYWVVFTTRPISGISHYVADGNTISGQTVSYTYWNGSSWTGVSTIGASADPTSGLAQSGKITWTSTVDSAKPKYLEDRLFYVYQGTLSDGSATISNITVDAPMQPIVDLWDGVFRQSVSFQTVTSSGTSDYTLEVNEGSSRIFPIGAKMGGLTADDHTIIIFEDRMQAVRFQMLSINETATPDLSGASVSYWNGSDYIVQSNQYDQTTENGIPLNKTGVISWQPPEREEEFKQSLYGVEGYAYKFVWNGTLDNLPNAGATLIDIVLGVPAPIKVQPFKFPIIYKNRLLLAGYTEGNQGNRIDYSVTNTTEAWNGLESSMDGIQSIYVGGDEDLTAGAQVYNQYSSRIITSLVLLKKTQTFLLLGDGPSGDDPFRVLPVSNNIGCPAPLTLATAEVSFGTSERQATKNIAMWLSYAGPIFFNGSVIIPIGGIDSYFDPSDTNYIGAENIEKAVGWYDITYKEYNLIVGTNWFVFSFSEKKWFQKYSPTLPAVGFQVADTNGSKYIYSGTTTGFLMRQENGTTWAETGNGIEQIIRTGDFFPIAGKDGQFDPWYTVRMRRLKVAYRVMSEAVTLDINHYVNSSVSAIALAVVPLDEGDNTYNRNTQSLNLLGWQHGLEFKGTTSATNKGARLQGYGYQYWIEREDDN